MFVARTGVEGRPVKLVNIYFDTPQLTLATSKSALRLRHTPDGWLQTFKTAGARRVYSALLAGAVEVVQLPFPAPDERAFWEAWNAPQEQAGLAIAWTHLTEHCDVSQRHARAWSDELATLPELATTLVESARRGL